MDVAVPARRVGRGVKHGGANVLGVAWMPTIRSKHGGAQPPTTTTRQHRRAKHPLKFNVKRNRDAANHVAI